MGAVSAADDLFAHRMVDMSVLQARAYNYRWAVQAPGVIPLTAADPDFPVAPEIVEAVQRYLRSGYFCYGPAAGMPELREAVARRQRERYRPACLPEQVFVANSAASALYLVAQFAINAPGEEAIIPDPVDFLLERSVLAAGGRVKRLRLHGERNFSFDPDELEALITPGRTKLVSICNPHNPLGRVLRPAELEALAGAALRHGLWILADEVWSDIVYKPLVHTSIAALGPDVASRTFSVLGFSKGYGLAGLRLGLLIAPSRKVCQALLRLSHANDTAYGVSTLSQVAGLAAYESAGGWLERFMAHLLRQRDYAVGRLNQMDNVACHTPEGTYVLFPDVSPFGIDSERMASELADRHRVAVVPGSPAFFGPGAVGRLRLSFATSREILAEGLDRLEAGLAEMAARRGA